MHTKCDSEPRENSKVEVQLNTLSQVNFASAQNDISVINGLTLSNQGDELISDPNFSLRNDPLVINPKTGKLICYPQVN